MAVSSNQKKYHVPIINARRGYVFGAIYDEEFREVLKPQHLKLEELLEKLKTIDHYELISNDTFDQELELVPYNPNFIKIIEHFKNRKEVNPHSVNPEYLKLTEAEESKL